MSELSTLRPFSSVEHNWEETTVYDCHDKPFCYFNIHDLGTVTEENEDEMVALMDKRVEELLKLLNGS